MSEHPTFSLFQPTTYLVQLRHPWLNEIKTYSLSRTWGYIAELLEDGEVGNYRARVVMKNIERVMMGQDVDVFRWWDLDEPGELSSEQFFLKWGVMAQHF